MGRGALLALVPALRDTDPRPPVWEPLLVRIVRAIGRNDAANVRQFLPAFATHFGREPLLYCPPSDGGKPREVLQRIEQFEPFVADSCIC